VHTDKQQSPNFDSAAIKSHLSDSMAPSRTYLGQLALLYQETPDEHLRALAGFQLLVAAAAAKKVDTNATDAKELPDFLGDPNAYLEDAAVVTYLLDDYCAIPPKWRDDLTALSFHEAGTTSFILKSYDEHYALKVIQPRFGNVTTITDATAGYRDQLKHAGQFAPKIYDSDSRWILMQFIPGSTLTKFTRDHLHFDSTLGRLDTIQSVVKKLCTALQDCAEHHVHHLDLSPDNIIVDHEEGTIKSIHLIDFGVNYLVQEHVGSVGGLSRAECFIAPELEFGAPSEPELADAYSLGMILLEMLGNQALQKDQLNEVLDYAWSNYQDLAAVIEDLIDTNPMDRYDLFAGTPVERSRTPRPSPLVFKQIRDAITEAVRLLALIKTKPRGHLKTINDFVNNIVPFEALEELWTRWTEANDFHSPGLRRLLHSGVLVQLLHTVTVAVFIWLILSPISGKRLCDTFGGCLLGANVPPLPISWNNMLWGRINGLLPGRIVAVSFSFTLSKYYADIFSTVTLRRIRLKEMRPLLHWAEFFVRWHPVMGIIPILYALVFDPKAWAFCSAAGLIGICLNNLFCYRVVLAEVGVQSGVEAANGTRVILFARPSNLLRDERGDFRYWWFMILEYCICLALVGVLVCSHLAQDEWLYAIFVSIFVNGLMMWRHNCRNRAPGVRTMLRRVLWRLERLDMKLSDNREGQAEVRSFSAT
jgi:serine/threonine protein kinase